MDNNSESSDCESVHESSDTEYDSDSSVCGESVIAFDDLPYDIQLIQLHKHLIWENFLKLHGPKLMSQRMDTWIFSLIVQ